MFDADAVLTGEQLVAVLEAARWAATWGHRQPVRFIVGLRGDDTFTKITELLKRGNRYAHAAGALIMVCIDEGEDDRTARYAAVDAGAAIAQLTIEAVSRGLVAHPMAGFNVDGAREVFGIPPGRSPSRSSPSVRSATTTMRRPRSSNAMPRAANGCHSTRWCSRGPGVSRSRSDQGTFRSMDDRRSQSAGAGVRQLREGVGDLGVQRRHLVGRRRRSARQVPESWSGRAVRAASR